MQKPKRSAAKGLKATESFESLVAKAQDTKYSNQKYDKDSMVTIPGTLFADFVNTLSSTHQILMQLQRNLAAAGKAIEVSLASQDVMQLSLMKQHIQNVEDGITTAVSEEELEAAVAEVTDVKATAE